MHAEHGHKQSVHKLFVSCSRFRNAYVTAYFYMLYCMWRVRLAAQGGEGTEPQRTAGSAAPRGLDARRRLVGPRPHGALTLCVPLGFVLRV